MHRGTILLMVLGAILVAEYYSFIVVRSALRSLPNGWRVGLLSFYVVMSVLAWLSIFLFRRIDWAHIPHLLRNIYVAFTLGFFVGKLFILLIMLVDDLRRLLMWMAHF